jgi:hypothetical protein
MFTNLLLILRRLRRRMFRQFINERTTNRYLPLIQKSVNKMLLHLLEDPERFLAYVSL